MYTGGSPNAANSVALNVVTSAFPPAAAISAARFIGGLPILHIPVTMRTVRGWTIAGPAIGGGRA